MAFWEEKLSVSVQFFAVTFEENKIYVNISLILILLIYFLFGEIHANDAVMLNKSNLSDNLLPSFNSPIFGKYIH